MSYQLSPDQVAALTTIGAWWRSHSAPSLTLGGYAGTGKTTLITYVRRAIKDNDPDTKVAFCAFTGKAVRVLQVALKRAKAKARGDSISTIHSLIYNSETDAAGHLTGWQRKPKLDYQLIIVDEASMVTAELWHDLLSFGIPVLAVGDHGQLPPVGDGFNLMAEPQIKLERVYRQAAESPIVAIATAARTTGEVVPGRYGDGVVKFDRSSDSIALDMEELLEAWSPDWLVLCGFNHTRVRLNHDLRAKLGFEGADPRVGDHVICLRNNPTAKLYNGMTGVITNIAPARDDAESLWWQATISIDEIEYDGFLLREQFGAKETVKARPIAPDGTRGDLFDFGYALTVHKAQGSQAQTVLLFEERSKHMDYNDWRRWLYTAVTRAEERLYIVGQP